MGITSDEAKMWLRIDIDNDQDDLLVNMLLETSEAEIKASTGVPADYDLVINDVTGVIHNLYCMCQRIFISDAYYERDTENKALLSYYMKLELEYKRCLINEN